jgi:hypothetical protein
LTIDKLKTYSEDLICVVPSYRAFKSMNKEKILPLLEELNK